MKPRRLPSSISITGPTDYGLSNPLAPARQRQISGGEYLFYSPAFYAESESNRVVELINIGLTNDPATKDMRPLVAARAVISTERDTMSKTVFVALTGRDDADEAAALSAAMALTDLRKEIFTLTGKQSFSEALGVLHANSVAAAEVVKLSAEIDQLRGAQRKIEIDKLVDEASRAGKVPPTKVEALKALGSRDIEALRATIDLLPTMPGQAPSPKPAPASDSSVVVVELSAGDRGRRASSASSPRRSKLTRRNGSRSPTTRRRRRTSEVAYGSQRKYGAG